MSYKKNEIFKITIVAGKWALVMNVEGITLWIPMHYLVPTHIYQEFVEADEYKDTYEKAMKKLREHR